MQILITGGFGYIGGRLAQHLSALGNKVVLGSRYTRDLPAWLPGATVLQTQWDSQASLRECCAQVDVVIHAAGMSASDCALDPAGALAFNGSATERLLQASIANEVKRFLFLSTAHVYSGTLIGEFTEDSPLLNQHPYATSRSMGEGFVRAVDAQGEIVGLVLRLANVFGMPTHKEAPCWDLLVNDLCRQVIITGQIVLNSCGSQERNFITMTDTCRSIAHLLQLKEERFGDRVFNIGSNESMSVRQMADLIAARYLAMFGTSPPVVAPKSSASEEASPLCYGIGRLMSTGFRLMDNAIAEIDDTLLFCRQAFGDA